MVNRGQDVSPPTVEAQSIEPTISVERRKRHFGPRMIFSVVIMCMGTLTYSYGAGVIATTIGQPSFYAYMKLDNGARTSSIIGATTSLYYAGGIFGAFGANFVADRWGRKASIYTGALTSLAAAALCAGSVHIAMFIVFRFLYGVGGFMLLMTVPLWITEVVPAEVRGAFAQCHGVCTSLGYFLSSYVGVGFYTNGSLKGGQDSWRGPLAIGAIPPILFLCSLWWVPESPRFLLLKEQTTKAWEIVRRFHSAPGDTDHRYAQIEMFQMKNQIELDRTLPTSWLFMFKTPSMRKRMCMTIFIVFAVLSSGNLCIATYATVIMSHSGWDSLAQLNIQAGMMAAVMPGIFAAIFFTEKFRRPTMVMIGLLGMTVVLSCYTGVAASVNLDAQHKAAQIACVALLYLFQIFSATFTEGPLSYWAAEFYPTHLRARGQTIQVVSYGAFSILWGQSGPTAISNIGWRFFLVFICITVVTSFVIYWYFPDTQGKSLEEMALLFGDDDLVVVRQQDIHIDADHHLVGTVHKDKEGQAIIVNLEDINDARESA
ncbi:uncharacterized protein Z520_05913 [Fonsecaea multimorphosa CBS 102226]|uniref:Major facilitator superfamily (MFS) profile domain-containing protein n=1 Tax=Fonsecaea multimorphosa CBS 102226 TaxID=1442371 RepID=A0A0D2JYJ4_9EURO|nr:uncharacterized protein Z520_05913 [Fonsecaea multimorphosa CBS 102226]KIX98612.1 hypothetical protein Z520_05913 [Fonsecaea multimorphosa CBS 102226]OAL24802.1 hypothetical protein AYO22_05591 [Fonsecaea multimorphosa]